ncbi:MAG: serpin family protein [Phycisphaerales bacterium]
MIARRVVAASLLVALCGTGLAVANRRSEPVPAPARATPAPVDPAAAKAAAAATTAFGVNLFRTLATDAPNGNLFISPYSMAVALTMAAEGARGETEAQMLATLAITGGAEGARAIVPLHASHRALAERFRQAAGTADQATEDRIKTLRADLNEANALTQRLEAGGNYSGARRASVQAESVARELNTLLTTVSRFDLRSANALWVERSFNLLPEYVETVGTFYGSGGATPLNFRTGAEAARTTINTWVEERTERRIRDLIPKDGISPHTRLIITNAVYFRGEWAEPFEESSTREEPFTLATGATTPARMMNDAYRSGVPYAAFTGGGEFFDTPRMVPADESKRPQVYPVSDGFTMIELPYKGGELSMVLIAPRAHDGLRAIEQRLTGPALAGWLERLDARSVVTALPRFKIDFAAEMSVPLKAMGMRRAFVSPGMPGAAEFSGISDGTSPDQQLFIGSVLHKAWVEVTEKGTEAAAATAVMAEIGAAMRREEMVPFTPVFRADRPFLFLIRDRATGAVIFMGRMSNPG